MSFPRLRPEPPPQVRIHYRRPPDRTEVFVQHLLHEDPFVKITFARDLRLDSPLRIGDRIALEDGSDAVWFTFPDMWHDIGRFYRADGTLTGIYANVLTPCVFEPEGVWRTTDLFLDVWIAAHDGNVEEGPAPHARLLDAHELAQAERNGWVSTSTAERARQEAERTLEGARAGTWPPPVVHQWTRDRVLELYSSRT